MVDTKPYCFFCQYVSPNLGKEVSPNLGKEVSNNLGKEVSNNLGKEVSNNIGKEVSRISHLSIFLISRYQGRLLLSGSNLIILLISR